MPIKKWPWERNGPWPNLKLKKLKRRFFQSHATESGDRNRQPCGGCAQSYREQCRPNCRDADKNSASSGCKCHRNGGKCKGCWFVDHSSGTETMRAASLRQSPCSGIRYPEAIDGSGVEWGRGKVEITGCDVAFGLRLEKLWRVVLWHGPCFQMKSYLFAVQQQRQHYCYNVVAVKLDED